MIKLDLNEGELVKQETLAYTIDEYKDKLKTLNKLELETSFDYVVHLLFKDNIDKFNIKVSNKDIQLCNELDCIADVLYEKRLLRAH